MCSISTPSMPSAPAVPVQDNDPLRDVILKDRDSTKFQALAMRGYQSMFLSGARGQESLPSLAPPVTPTAAPVRSGATPLPTTPSSGRPPAAPSGGFGWQGGDGSKPLGRG